MHGFLELTHFEMNGLPALSYSTRSQDDKNGSLSCIAADIPCKQICRFTQEKEMEIMRRSQWGVLL